VINNGFFALRAPSAYFILEKFHQIAAHSAFYIEDGLVSPIMGIIAGAFSHML
jgi:hypothetical protein